MPRLSRSLGLAFALSTALALCAPSEAGACGGGSFYQENVCFDPYGANSSYNWELFFHAPLYVATRLSRNGKYEEAMRWFHFIFDPTTDAPQAAGESETARYWKVAPFKKTPASSLEDWFRSLTPNGNPGTVGNAYATWKSAYGITDDLADPDQDGLNNFGEFALGRHPTTPDASPSTPLIVTIDTQDYLAIAVRRNLAATDAAALTIESSNDLATWSPNAVFVSETNHGDGTATTTWRSPQPIPANPRLHLRARFTLR